ncbi:hypothetical protein ACHAWX_000044, partial [Stephanocyclus meneghinianus]
MNTMRTISHLSTLSWIFFTAAAAKRPFIPHRESRGPPSLPLVNASSRSSLRNQSAVSVAIACPRGGSNDLETSEEFHSDDDDNDEQERDSQPQTSLQRTISSLSSVFTHTIYPHAAS